MMQKTNKQWIGFRKAVGILPAVDHVQKANKTICEMSLEELIEYRTELENSIYQTQAKLSVLTLEKNGCDIIITHIKTSRGIKDAT